MNLTLKEIIKLKKELEMKFKNDLVDFEKKTGLMVDEVFVQNLRVISPAKVTNTIEDVIIKAEIK